MKRAILSVLLLLFAFLTGFAQNRNICRLGITYDINQSDHWEKQTGYHRCHPLLAGRACRYQDQRYNPHDRRCANNRYFAGRDR